jgi:hypothetical protein
MNERIKTLAEQAGYTPLPGFDFANDLQEVFLEKFAELIVLECAGVCDEIADSERVGDQVTDSDYCSYRIKKYFGVKE